VVALRGTVSNRSGVGAKVRIETSGGGIQVRELGVARGFLSSSEPVLHFGIGESEAVELLTVIWPTGDQQTFHNLAANRRLVITESGAAGTADAAESEPGESTAQFVEVARFLGLEATQPSTPFEELAAQPLLPFRQKTVGPALAIGDLNGDRVDDVVIGGTEGQPLKMMIAQADGTYAAQPTMILPSDTETADGAILVFDANGDGMNDLFITKGGVSPPAGSSTYGARLYLNGGRGNFGEDESAIPTGFVSNGGPAVAADFNRDGWIDVFVGGRARPGEYPVASRSALLVNSGQSFADQTAALAEGLSDVGLVSGALWSDVDGDGWLDLLVALQWGSVCCWRNVEGVRFEDVSEKLGFAAAGTGWWNSIAAADFNGDGQSDYVVGNVGLNTRYRATPEKPFLLLRGAVDDSGKPQLLEAEYEGDTLVPVRGRSTMERVMPWIGKKIPAFKSYAAASLEDIFGRERIAAAQRFAVTELRSGVFLSQRDGGYRFQPLPRMAQIAPIFGLVAGDFDGDGHADIYAVQNSYAPIPEVGRFAGGLSQMLRGEGKGGFHVVPLSETHLVVPGDAKGLAVLDVDRDGRPELMVTRSGDTSMVFGNAGLPGRSTLAVSLRGRPGNLAAIGARITAVATDGSTQTSEVSAGAGYRTQSSATQFFGSLEANPLKTIRVRWPWGETTEANVPRRPGTMVISAPRE
jgi:hypothetical protein